MSKKRHSPNMQRRTTADAGELEQLRAENERLRRENERLSATHPDEKAAFTLWLREVYHNRGFPGVVEEMYAIQQALNTVTTEFNAMREAHLGEILRVAEHQPDKTIIAAVLFICAPDMPEVVEAQTIKPQVFMGDRYEAAATLTPQLIFALKSIPTAEDIKKQTLDGISSDQLKRVITRLFDTQYSPDTFEERRRAEFKLIWEQLEREYPNQYLRHTVQDTFDTIVKRTGERMAQRLQNTTLSRTDYVDLLRKRA